MTLLRQLVIVIVALFVLLFAGAVAINLHNTRSYLNDQLRTISQDTATSLGLSLSPHIAANELKIAESMVNAVSDSGYYSEVLVADIHGKPLIERRQPPAVAGVPQWFIDLVPLETPVGEALIMSGWQQAGTVRLSANPGHAYATLWRNGVDALVWFFAASLLVFGLGILALHFVLRPLRAVEQQARAICDREYPVQARLPWTLELRSVVSAMNLMTEKVKEMFREQADAMERLRASTYVDAVTGLANRQYFDLQLKQLTKQRSTSSTNALLFIELAEFKEFNARRGYQAGDELLRSCGALIAATCRSQPNLDHFVARLSGAGFAVVIQDTYPADAEACAAQIAQALPELRDRGLTDSATIGHIGLAIHSGQTASELLSAADAALRAAQAAGPCAHRSQGQQSSEGFAAYPVERWREILTEALDRRRIALYRQPCVASRESSKVLQYEVLMRIHDRDGALIPANVLIPVAKHLRLTGAIDRLVVATTLDRLALPENATLVAAVNLFPQSIQDADFVDSLETILRAHPDAARRIAFEVAELGATADLDALRGWVARIAATGARTGLDQVGRGFRPFAYLGTLKLDYIKVDGSYARGLHENRDNQFFVDALVKYAHGLDLQVIAESVETDEEREMLQTLRVDGVKGYGVGRPEAWEG